MWGAAYNMCFCAFTRALVIGHANLPRTCLPYPYDARAGCEPFSIWEGIDPKSEEYRQLKEERAKVLMDAVEVGATGVFASEKKNDPTVMMSTLGGGVDSNVVFLAM